MLSGACSVHNVHNGPGLATRPCGRDNIRSMADLRQLIASLVVAAVVGVVLGRAAPEWVSGLVASPQAHLARGDEYCAAGEYDLAIAEYTRAIQLHPGFAEAYNNRAYASFTKGAGSEDPLPDLNRAIELREHFPHAYNTRGCVHLSRGQLDLAIADFTRALELRADYPRACNNRANAWLRKGEIRRALADWERGGKKPKRVLLFLGGLALLVLGMVGAAVYAVRKSHI